MYVGTFVLESVGVMIVTVSLRFRINDQATRASLIGTVDLAGLCKPAHFDNERPLILPGMMQRKQAQMIILQCQESGNCSGQRNRWLR